MSKRTSDFSDPNKNSARRRATSVLPTPVGPRKKKQPTGRRGDLRPARLRRMARAKAVMALSWLMTRLRSEEHTSELQSHSDLVCRLLLEKKTEYSAPAYHRLVGFQFIQEHHAGDVQGRVVILHHVFDECFHAVLLLQWNRQVKSN